MLLLLSAVYLSPLWGYVCGVVAFLYTCRPSGAFRGWCAGDFYRLRTLVLFKQALRLFNLGFYTFLALWCETPRDLLVF